MLNKIIIILILFFSVAGIKSQAVDVTLLLKEIGPVNGSNFIKLINLSLEYLEFEQSLQLENKEVEQPFSSYFTALNQIVSGQLKCSGSDEKPIDAQKNNSLDHVIHAARNYLVLTGEKGGNKYLAAFSYINQLLDHRQSKLKDETCKEGKARLPNSDFSLKNITTEVLKHRATELSYIISDLGANVDNKKARAESLILNSGGPDKMMVRFIIDQALPYYTALVHIYEKSSKNTGKNDLYKNPLKLRAAQLAVAFSILEPAYTNVSLRVFSELSTLIGIDFTNFSDELIQFTNNKFSRELIEKTLGSVLGNPKRKFLIFSESNLPNTTFFDLFSKRLTAEENRIDRATKLLNCIESIAGSQKKENYKAHLLPQQSSVSDDEKSKECLDLGTQSNSKDIDLKLFKVSWFLTVIETSEKLKSILSGVYVQAKVIQELSSQHPGGFSELEKQLNFGLENFMHKIAYHQPVEETESFRFKVRPSEGSVTNEITGFPNKLDFELYVLVDDLKSNVVNKRLQRRTKNPMFPIRLQGQTTTTIFTLGIIIKNIYIEVDNQGNPKLNFESSDFHIEGLEGYSNQGKIYSILQLPPNVEELINIDYLAVPEERITDLNDINIFLKISTNAEFRKANDWLTHYNHCFRVHGGSTLNSIYFKEKLAKKKCDNIESVSDMSLDKLSQLISNKFRHGIFDVITKFIDTESKNLTNIPETEYLKNVELEFKTQKMDCTAHNHEQKCVSLKEDSANKKVDSLQVDLISSSDLYPLGKNTPQDSQIKFSFGLNSSLIIDDDLKVKTKVNFIKFNDIENEISKWRKTLANQVNRKLIEKFGENAWGDTVSVGNLDVFVRLEQSESFDILTHLVKDNDKPFSIPNFEMVFKFKFDFWPLISQFCKNNASFCFEQIGATDSSLVQDFTVLWNSKSGEFDLSQVELLEIKLSDLLDDLQQKVKKKVQETLVESTSGKLNNYIEQLKSRLRDEEGLEFDAGIFRIQANMDSDEQLCFVLDTDGVDDSIFVRAKDKDKKFTLMSLVPNKINSLDELERNIGKIVNWDAAGFYTGSSCDRAKLDKLDINQLGKKLLAKLGVNDPRVWRYIEAVHRGELLTFSAKTEVSVMGQQTSIGFGEFQLNLRDFSLTWEGFDIARNVESILCDNTNISNALRISLSEGINLLPGLNFINDKFSMAMNGAKCNVSFQLEVDEIDKILGNKVRPIFELGFEILNPKKSRKPKLVNADDIAAALLIELGQFSEFISMLMKDFKELFKFVEFGPPHITRPYGVHINRIKLPTKNLFGGSLIDSQTADFSYPDIQLLDVDLIETGIKWRGGALIHFKDFAVQLGALPVLVYEPSLSWRRVEDTQNQGRKVDKISLNTDLVLGKQANNTKDTADEAKASKEVYNIDGEINVFLDDNDISKINIRGDTYMVGQKMMESSASANFDAEQKFIAYSGNSTGWLNEIYSDHQTGYLSNSAMTLSTRFDLLGLATADLRGMLVVDKCQNLNDLLNEIKTNLNLATKDGVRIDQRTLADGYGLKTVMDIRNITKVEKCPFVVMAGDVAFLFSDFNSRAMASTDLDDLYLYGNADFKAWEFNVGASASVTRYQTVFILKAVGLEIPIIVPSPTDVDMNYIVDILKSLFNITPEAVLEWLEDPRIELTPVTNNSGDSSTISPTAIAHDPAALGSVDGQKTTIVEEGDKKTTVVEEGDKKTTVVEEGDKKTTVVEEGGKKTIVVEEKGEETNGTSKAGDRTEGSCKAGSNEICVGNELDGVPIKVAMNEQLLKILRKVVQENTTLFTIRLSEIELDKILGEASSTLGYCSNSTEPKFINDLVSLHVRSERAVEVEGLDSMAISKGEWFLVHWNELCHPISKTSFGDLVRKIDMSMNAFKECLNNSSCKKNIIPVNTRTKSKLDLVPEYWKKKILKNSNLQGVLYNDNLLLKDHSGALSDYYLFQSDLEVQSLYGNNFIGFPVKSFINKRSNNSIKSKYQFVSVSYSDGKPGSNNANLENWVENAKVREKILKHKCGEIYIEVNPTTKTTAFGINSMIIDASGSIMRKSSEKQNVHKLEIFHTNKEDRNCIDSVINVDGYYYELKTAPIQKKYSGFQISDLCSRKLNQNPAIEYKLFDALSKTSKRAEPIYISVELDCNILIQPKIDVDSKYGLYNLEEEVDELKCQFLSGQEMEEIVNDVHNRPNSSDLRVRSLLGRLLEECIDETNNLLNDDIELERVSLSPDHTKAVLLRKGSSDKKIKVCVSNLENFSINCWDINKLKMKSDDPCEITISKIKEFGFAWWSENEFKLDNETICAAPWGLLKKHNNGNPVLVKQSNSKPLDECYCIGPKGECVSEADSGLCN